MWIRKEGRKWHFAKAWVADACRTECGRKIVGVRTATDAAKESAPPPTLTQLLLGEPEESECCASCLTKRRGALPEVVLVGPEAATAQAHRLSSIEAQARRIAELEGELRAAIADRERTAVEVGEYIASLEAARDEMAARNLWLEGRIGEARGSRLPAETQQRGDQMGDDVGRGSAAPLLHKRQTGRE